MCFSLNCLCVCKTQVEYEIKAQMLEIYNESLRDLLVPKDTSNKLDILSTQSSGCNVPNAIKVRRRKSDWQGM